MPSITIELDETLLEGDITSEVLSRAAVSLASQVEREVRSVLTRRIETIANDEIRDMIKPKLKEAFGSLLQPTDGFGHPKGEPRTLAEVIVETARKELTTPSDRYDPRSATVIQKIIHDEVQRQIAGELKEAVQQGREEVLAAIQAKASEIIGETVARMAKV